jgi:succinoglycan biosynthesis protein ExoA
MTDAPVDVSVLIPVFNEEAYLERATAAMLDQTYEGSVEYLFIDGRSTDASRAMLDELAARDPRVIVLDNPARSTPNALNIGLRRARGTFVARMDAHTYYSPDYLAIGVERMLRGGAVSVSGPMIATPAGGWSPVVALALNMTFGTGGATFRHTRDAEFEVDTGFLGVWYRDTLVEHGGWNEEWPIDQDFELAVRLRQAGGKLLCVPAMAAAYIPRDTLRGLMKQYWRYGYYRTKTALRHPSSMRRSQAAPPAIATTAALAVVAPRYVRLAARAGLGAWLLATSRASLRARAQGAPVRDAAALPIVFAIMHFTYGFGFLAGCVRMGVPFEALRGLARKRDG